MQPTYGGYGPAGTTAVSGQNETQTLGFSAHPYLRQSFNDLGFAELGATVSHASQNGVAGSLAAGQPAPGTVGAQNPTSEQEYFSLTSGPAFGRTSAGLMLSASQDNGNGVLSNAYQNTAVMNLGYAVTRSITALVSFGYDDIHYAGTPPYNYTGPQWSVGAHWISQSGQLRLGERGCQEGEKSTQMDASYGDRPHPRVRALFGRTDHRPATTVQRDKRVLPGRGNPVAHGVPCIQQQLLRRAEQPVASDRRLGHGDHAARARCALGDLQPPAEPPDLRRQQRLQQPELHRLVRHATWQRSLWPDLNASAFVQWGTNQGLQTGPGQNPIRWCSA